MALPLDHFLHQHYLILTGQLSPEAIFSQRLKLTLTKLEIFKGQRLTKSSNQLTKCPTAITSML